MHYTDTIGNLLGESMILDNITCSDIGFVINIVKWLIKLIQFGIPIILIAMVIFDLVKVVATGTEDQAKKSTTTIVKRIVWAVVAFFVPMLIGFIFKNISNGSSSGGLAGPVEWMKCLFD